MLAEYAMNEFSFKDGVIDRVSLKKKIEKLVPTLKMGLSIAARFKRLNYAQRQKLNYLPGKNKKNALS